MPPTPQRPKRRTYLVDRSFQLKYMIVLGGWGLLLSVLFGMWLWQSHAHLAARGTGRGGEWLIVAVILGLGLLSAVALALVGFIMSARIAGPVYVMGRDLRLLAQGHFPGQRALRRDDELKNLFELFRHAVDALHVREERRTAMLEEVLAALRAAAPRAPDLAPAIALVEEEVRDRRAALAESARDRAP
jgi:hypothetical protein